MTEVKEFLRAATKDEIEQVVELIKKELATRKERAKQKLVDKALALLNEKNKFGKRIYSTAEIAKDLSVSVAFVRNVRRTLDEEKTTL